MSHHITLDPRRSVVVEACAGSGKTWLLVSRIVRLLLEGAQPAQILAITFTRKAAQEMQARLQLWLRELAMGDDAYVRTFFAERGIASLSDEQMLRARALYQEVLLAQPGITISTFHGWFMQVMQRAPLNADVMQGMSLLERAGAEQQEAWEALLEQMRKQPDGDEARHMQWLFETQGLFNTHKLLFNFLAKRAEWWAYTQGQSDPLTFALEDLRDQLAVDMDVDPVADWGMCGNSEEVLFAFVRQLASDGTVKQKEKAAALERAWTDSDPADRFKAIGELVLTQKNGFDGRIKASAKQDAAAFDATRAALACGMQEVFDIQVEQQAWRLNEAVLHCGVALLARYQKLKAQKQQMDFSDLEWQLCRLLQQSEHAETMQYKLDSRYRHVLLDEFQDTNPLQWQIMRAWFDASVAVASQPTVFVVGDPKQSIYRFRRADARLFGVARDYLVAHFAALCDGNASTRRNAQAVVDAVNAVFREQPEGFEFVEHETHQKELPGHVLVLPLAVAADVEETEASDAPLTLRDPLTTKRTEAGEGARHQEAALFATQLQSIVREWSVRAQGGTRRAAYGDIMVLVRSRTHLAIYEEALRARHIPFISSRRGGLLDTLEAEDIQALLLFLITPFADLALAQVLRTPIFACSDADLMRLAAAALPQAEETGRTSWWQRLRQSEGLSPALQQAADALQRWLALADKLPVHDLLDRIYHEGDVIARYHAAMPEEMRHKVVANLHAFMEQALKIDSGRYPSLPRFLQELREMRDSTDDAPDEGKLGAAGDAVRIYTVHESKGLEAPIVWLLDANTEQKRHEGCDVLLDWPTHETRPLQFSFYADQASRGRKRQPLFELDAAEQAREEMNLLYVAMTRAQQALVVSGNQGARETKRLTWHGRIAAVAAVADNPMLVNVAAPIAEPLHEAGRVTPLPAIVPVGKRLARNTEQQQRGIWLHALLQLLTEGQGEREILRQRLSIPPEEMEVLWHQAHSLLESPLLARYFDPRQYRSACNEMPYINARGEVKRIDRLVEFDDEVWVLDYKLAEAETAGRYAAQMAEYRTAMQAVHTGKPVRCALIFANGALHEL